MNLAITTVKIVDVIDTAATITTADVTTVVD